MDSSLSEITGRRRTAGWRAAGRAVRSAGVGAVALLGATVTALPAQEARDAPPGVPDYVLDTLHVDAVSRTGQGRAVVTRSVEVLDRAEIEQIPARDVGDLLRWLTGVETRARSAAQADLSIRGSSFEQVLVLVDGVRMNDPQTGHFALDLTVPLEDIERIEVLRGPASALHGADALAGVVNIVTATAPGAGDGVGLGAARLEAGAFGQAGAALTGRAAVGEVDLSGGAEFRRSDGHRAGTDSRVAKTTIRAGGPVGGGRLRTDLGFALRDFGANGFYSAFDSYEETRTLTASARWIPGRSPGDGGVRLEPRISFRLHDDDFVLVRGDPEFYRNLHTNWQAGGELVARMSPADGTALAAGVEGYRDVLESDNLGDRAETRGALFVELTAGRVGEALVTAGLRGDVHEVYGAEASPSASVAVWPTSDLKLRGSVGRSFRTPSWTERFLESPANVGSADLDPERAWSGELGAEMRLGALRLGATGFLRRADGLIDWSRPVDVDPGGPWRSRNVETAIFRGLEITGRTTELAGVRVEAALELLSVEAEANSGFVSKRALRPLTRKIRLEARRSIGPVTIAARAMQARRRGGEEPFYRTDLRVGYRVGHGSLYVEGTNLTDDRYPDITGHPAPGRAVVAGLRWEGAPR